MRQRLLSVGVVAAALGLWPLGARAQAPAERWVFVPVFVNGGAASGEEAGLLTLPLERDKDLSTLPNTAASAHFEAVASSEPGTLTDTQLKQLMSSLGEGTKHLSSARGKSRREKAERDLSAAIEALDPKSRDYVQRSPERAQALFHACLLTAQPAQDDKQESPAEHQMQRCVRAFPGYEPMTGIPKDTVRRFEEARTQLAAEPHGSVELVSTRQGCVVRANGLALGKTPLTLSLPVGLFRFQVECDDTRPGRVHALSVHPGSTRMSIDTHLDDVVHTHNALWLTYSDAATRDAQMDTDARALSPLLDLSRVILLVVENGSLPSGPVQVRVRDPSPKPHDLGRLVWTEGRYAGPVGTVTRELVAATRHPAPAPALPTAAPPPSAAFDPAPAIATQDQSTPDADDDDEASEPSSSALPLIAAGTLGVLGTGALVVSWAAYAKRFDLRTQLYFQSVPFGAQRDFRAAGNWTLTLAAAGSALLAAAEPLVLPRSDGMPMAGWLAGGAGVAVAAVGLGFGVFGRHCAPQVAVPGRPGCGAFVADSVFGPLVALHAVPLFAVPITYAIRHWLENDSLEIGFGVDSVVLSGRL